MPTEHGPPDHTLLSGSQCWFKSMEPTKCGWGSQGISFSPALIWLMFKAIYWTQTHLSEHPVVSPSHSPPTSIISVLKCAERAFMYSQCLPNKIPPTHTSGHLSCHLFPSSVSLPAMGKDGLEKHTLSISFNSLCYDMFDSSWRTLSGLENEPINFRY